MAKEKNKPQTDPTADAVEEPVEEQVDTEKAPEEVSEETAEEKLQNELSAEKEKYLRLYAEYDNFRKRTGTEKLQIYDDATARAVKEILPLADSVTQALLQLEGKQVPEEFSKGLELISAQLRSSFDKLSIEAFGEVGDAFDPAIHNAVSMTEDAALPENAVAAVYQKGYKIHDKIIRHAMVVVANT